MTFEFVTFLKWLNPVKNSIQRHAALESRVSALEKKLDHRSEDDCPKCGGQKYFVSLTTPRHTRNEYGKQGVVYEYERTYTCQECGMSEMRYVKTRK